MSTLKTPPPPPEHQYDYIVVGGGTAGCILANRLTASGEYRVLMVEAGKTGKGFWIPIPAGFSKLLTNPIFNWRFKTEPEESVNGRSIAIPRGKGLGGSTLINGMIYVRGQPEDYDRWAREDGAQGWGYDEVAPYFRRVEHTAVGDEERGRDGPMRITEVQERYPISEAFLRAAQEDGQLLNADYNGRNQEGFGYYQVSQWRGRRWSVVDGYLLPARHRSNLTVMTEAMVTSLDLDGPRCTGITISLKSGSIIKVGAKREVVMAAGAIQTPQLLELSGIGRPDVLEQAGIPVAHALPGVGENYIDHYATRMNWRVKGTRTLNEMTRGYRLALSVAEYYSKRTGILTLGTGLAFGFVKTRPEMLTPDVQFFFMHASYANAAERRLDKSPGMTIGVAQLRPKSRGSIHVRHSDPAQAPRIRPNLLGDPGDGHCLVEGMKIARRIVNQPAMQQYVDAELNPGPGCCSDKQWLDFARQNGQTIYHPIGTCRMGTDALAVVDPRLKLRGLEGIRVIDASVMPSMVSGNTQAAVMMIAEKGADMILQDAAASRSTSRGL
ncbi:MAG: GMC family oxidoreductase N-terminal domain-containing protein [Pusillimonas sp.]